MITLEFGSYSRARVWTDELPDLRYEVAQTFEQRLTAPLSIPGQERSVAGEVWRYVGPRGLYALLGAQFTPQESEHLLIQVAVSVRDGDAVHWSLARTIGDPAFAGLPEEYAPFVLQGIGESESVLRLGSGVLRVDRAAHSPVASVPFYYRKLAAILVDLLCCDPVQLSEEKLSTLLHPSRWGK